jgi:hypothetical protein
MKSASHVLLILLAGLSFAGSGCATPARIPVPVAERQVTLGTVQVDPVLRCVIATGFVNQVEGAIELLACGPGGKVHESVLVLQVDPVDLQTALLLVGLKPGPPMRDLGVGPPLGDAVSIWVTWQQEGRTVALPLEDLAYEWRTKRALRTRGWIFNGSLFENGKFKALAEESLIASYWDPWAILNVASELGADDDALSVNRAVMPPLHTPVTVILERR